MEKIIYFVENEKRHGVIRFVKSYRKGSWFRRERIEYCLTSTDGCSFTDKELAERVFSRIKKDYPNAKIVHEEIEAFTEKYDKHRFWVIARWGKAVREF